MSDQQLIWTPGQPRNPQPARSIIVAPRLPSLNAATYNGNPFTSEGDVYAECGTDGCGYKAMGARADVKLAMDAHRKMYHSQETNVVLLNHPRL